MREQNTRTLKGLTGRRDEFIQQFTEAMKRISDRLPHWPTSRDWHVPALLFLTFVVFCPFLGRYYFYDDGRLLFHAWRTANEGLGMAFAPVFHGHLRPLPILTTCGIGSVFGDRSPIPFHLASLLIHFANIILVYRVSRLLLCQYGHPPFEGIAMMVTVLFAWHWAGSEAVTYYAAIGVLWSTLGGLLAASVMMSSQWRWLPSYLLVTAALLIALGGGEYGLACAGPLAILASWNQPGLPSRRYRWSILLAAGIPLIVGYVILQLRLSDQGRLGTQYTLGGHILVHLMENVARLSIPSGLTDEPLAALLFLSFMMAAGLRTDTRRGMVWVAAAVLAMIPFAPSLQGNYCRFLYPAAPWFFIGIGLMTAHLSKHWDFRKQTVLASAGVVLLLTNLVYLNIRAWPEKKRGEHLRDLVHQVAKEPSMFTQRSPSTISIANDIEAGVETLMAFGVFPLNNAFHQETAPALLPGEHRIELVYSRKHGFETASPKTMVR